MRLTQLAKMSAWGWAGLLSFTLFSGSILNAGQLEDLVSQERWSEALEVARSQPATRAEHYYNLGTLYLRLGQSGPAVAYLEKASLMAPRDGDIRQNLAAARAALSRTLGESRLDPATSAWQAALEKVPMNEIRGAIGLMALLCTAFWLRAYGQTRSLVQALTRPSGGIALAGFALAGALYLAQITTESQPGAVALKSEIIRSGPGESFFDLGRLEPGMKVRLLGPEKEVTEDGGKKEIWRQVRFSSDAVGWTRSSAILLLRGA